MAGNGQAHHRSGTNNPHPSTYRLRAFVLQRRRRALRGLHPPCGTLSVYRSLMIRTLCSARSCLKSGLRRDAAGPLIDIITRLIPFSFARRNASLITFSVANCDERFDFLKPAEPVQHGAKEGLREPADAAHVHRNIDRSQEPVQTAVAARTTGHKIELLIAAV